MVKKNDLKLGLIAPLPFYALAMTAAAIYFVSAHTIFSSAAVMLFLLSGVIGFAPILLTVMDVSGQKSFDRYRKCLWILGALFLGFIVPTLYYVFEVKKRPE